MSSKNYRTLAGRIKRAMFALMVVRICGIDHDAAHGKITRQCIRLNLPRRTDVARFSRSICMTGFLLLTASLFLPVVQHGKPLVGAECAFVSSAILTFPESSTQSDTWDAWYCRAAWLANGCAFVVVLLAAIGGKACRTIAYFVLALLFVLIVVLCYADFSSIEYRYFGYYIWLCGLLMLGLSGISLNLRREQ